MTSLLIFLSAMFLHELGHVSAALVFGVKCYRIGWGLPGMCSQMDMPETRFVFGFITLAGPIVSAAFFLWACTQHYNTFALSNATIFIFSAFPGGDFWRLFEYSGLRTKALINRRLAEVGR